MKIKLFFLKNGLFIGLFVLISGAYGIFGTMEKGPYSRHQWRQADCLSITQNYYQDNLPFLEPEIHWQGERASDKGKTISEFPAMYYFQAKLWKLCGKQYWTYRSLNFIIFFIGLLYLKRLADLLIPDKFWAHFVPLFLYTSPLLVFFSNNFLMNSTAFSLVLIASYHYYLFLTTGSYKRLIYACLLFTLSGLFKLTSLLVFFAFGAILFYEVFIREKSVRERWKEFLPFIGTLSIQLIWYSYVGWYNSHNLKMVFLQGILPIWRMDRSQIFSNFDSLYHTLLPEFFHPAVLFILFATVLVLILFRKKANPYLLALLCLVLTGTVGYCILFFEVFNVHDYYLINLLILIPVLTLTLFDILMRNAPGILSSKLSKIAATVLMLFLVYNTSLKTREKYSSGTDYIRNSFLLSDKEVGFWDWFHWNYDHTYAPLETIEPYLDSLGIDRKTKVISLPDISINISLYLMNRKGYSGYGYGDYKEGEKIEAMKKNGAEYLIISDPALLQEKYLQPYLLNKVGSYKHVEIYKL